MWPTEEVPSVILQDGFDPENSFVVPPGSQRELRVRLQRADGSGLAGIDVIFSVPIAGPSGTFPDSQTETRTFVRVTSDASGNANTMIVTNDTEGVFEVGVGVEGFEAFNFFTFTNTTSPPEAAATAQKVREAAQEQLLKGTPNDTNVQLHGPSLLPSGTIISTPAIPIAGRGPR